jgi:hypothetical protein
MKRFPVVILAGLLIAAALVAALGSAASGQSAGRPALLVVDQRPFTVQGRHFRSHERVNVTLYKGQQSIRTRRVTASSSGGFRAVLQETAVDRCDTIFVRAVGTRGSNAVLKLLPRPACHSTRLGGAATSVRPTLTITSMHPLEVIGRGFKPSERVVVSTATKRKTVTANSAGRFDVRFAGLKCAGATIVAVGSKGSRAATRPPRILCIEP